MVDQFTNNTNQNRFEYHVGDQIVFADYIKRGDWVAITHVEAPVALRGTGAAGQLMRHIMETAKTDRFKIKPICPYAVAWLNKHPEYAEQTAD